MFSIFCILNLMARAPSACAMCMNAKKAELPCKPKSAPPPPLAGHRPVRAREGRLFELGGLKLKGKSDCQIRFPLRRILRHSRRRRRQLETWTSFLSVRQSLSTARNAFLLILNPSRVTACTPRRGRLLRPDRRHCCCCCCLHDIQKLNSVMDF